eukprot:jgi/Mesvir1/15229/Mv06456-RA.1
MINYCLYDVLMGLVCFGNFFTFVYIWQGLNLGEQMKKAAVSFMDCVCDPYSFPSRDLVTSNSPSCPDPSREHSSHMSTGERHLRDMFSWVVREATSPGSCARDNSDIHASTSQVGIQHGFAGCMASDMDDGFRGDGGAAVPRVAVPPGQKPEVSSQGPSGTCVFIDDINALGMVAGYGSLAADFVHYCRALAPRPAREGGGPPPRCSVVALLHRDIPADAMLASALLHAADVVLHVDALETGHAADVHGQVTIEHRTSAFLAAAQQQAASAGTPDHTPPVWPLPQRLQYRVYENSCTFFLPGVFRGS